ncbi:MAG TPA: M18 family aminopeptidase, partial [Ilumatobacteraceae bacterium]
DVEHTTTTHTDSADPTADLRAFLDASPSPFHAVASAVRRLTAAGFVALDERATWPGEERGFVVRGGAVVAWRLPAGGTDPTAPFRIVGAHTDSPCLRVKPHPDTGSEGWKQLAVEVYGGVLLNSWLDRDLGVAGQVVHADGRAEIVLRREPIARVPQLAIHLDRDVNERGLVLDKQQHLSPVWGTGVPTPGGFAAHLGVPDAVSWNLSLFDVTPAAVLGGDTSLLASGRLDNLVSCWAAVDALTAAAPDSGPDISSSAGHVSVIALFDHEEVGSESTTGASGPILETVVERLVLARGGDRQQLHRALAASSCISADNAHAVHPNYPERHEPGHRPIVNRGPALKVNSNQRYATSPETAALFARACAAARVPMQTFVSRNNMPCGSTIGPITATRLGIATVDVGVPQLSMHSARELCGAEDPLHLAAALRAYFAGA